MNLSVSIFKQAISSSEIFYFIFNAWQDVSYFVFRGSINYKHLKTRKKFHLHMTIVDSIAKKHKEGGIYVNPAATIVEIIAFEKQIGFSLPEDFLAFYSYSNGFSCSEDIFNMMPLSTITLHPQDFGLNWFYFAEYMIYSDTWGLRLTTNKTYEIFNGSYPTISLTSSLEEFLSRFLKGNVFEKGGLYEWHDELNIKLGNAVKGNNQC